MVIKQHFIFFETSAEGCQIVETYLKSNIRDRSIAGEKFLGFEDPFGTEIIIKRGIGILFEKP